ncbi:ATP-binding cassette domain-containing protein [Paenibacillus sabuli]|uniref:ATP-binding cassette domain-containing protein n=1 Tax=Paenibacillus sabuli TaxID=2772509 RepID=UPI00295B4C07|nr:ATP-binding cassette domain-containing protein [Paenibacillus sabuli]
MRNDESDTEKVQALYFVNAEQDDGREVDPYGLAYLAMLQFTEADLSKMIGNLSDGQKARVALAKCLLSGAAVIVLDEPANHLDLMSIQVMEQALIHFPGAAITGRKC